MKQIKSMLIVSLMLLCCNLAEAQPVQSTPEYQKAMQLLAQGTYEQAIEELKTLLGNGLIAKI